MQAALMCTAARQLLHVIINIKHEFSVIKH